MKAETKSIVGIKAELDATFDKIEATQSKYAVANDELEAELEKARSRWFDKWGSVVNERLSLETHAEVLENRLRNRLVDEYESTGETGFGKGLSVKVNKSVEFDESDAIDFAKKKAKFLLVETVDKGKIKKLGDELPFVKVIEKPVAVIEGLDARKKALKK